MKKLRCWQLSLKHNWVWKYVVDLTIIFPAWRACVLSRWAENYVRLRSMSLSLYLTIVNTIERKWKTASSNEVCVYTWTWQKKDWTHLHRFHDNNINLLNKVTIACSYNRPTDRPYKAISLLWTVTPLLLLHKKLWLASSSSASFCFSHFFLTMHRYVVGRRLIICEMFY